MKPGVVFNRCDVFVDISYVGGYTLISENCPGLNSPTLTLNIHQISTFPYGTFDFLYFTLVGTFDL